MLTWQSVCLVFAFVFAALAAGKIPEHPRISFGWLAFALFLAVEVFSRTH